MPYFSAEIDSFTALSARDPLAFVSGEFLRRQVNFYPLRREQVVV